MIPSCIFATFLRAAVKSCITAIFLRSGPLQENFIIDEEAAPVVKQSKESPVEKQAVFENHHEPIIDRDTWERVQELHKQRNHPNRYDEVGLFSSILFCADCGSVMYQQRYQTDKWWQDCYATMR